MRACNRDHRPKGWDGASRKPGKPGASLSRRSRSPWPWPGLRSPRWRKGTGGRAPMSSYRWRDYTVVRWAISLGPKSLWQTLRRSSVRLSAVPLPRMFGKSWDRQYRSFKACAKTTCISRIWLSAAPAQLPFSVLHRGDRARGCGRGRGFVRAQPAGPRGWAVPAFERDPRERRGHSRFRHRAAFSVAGIYSYTEELGGCIAVNARHPAERRRWSMAHEYGHFLTRRFQSEISPGRLHQGPCR